MSETVIVCITKDLSSGKYIPSYNDNYIINNESLNIKFSNGILTVLKYDQLNPFDWVKNNKIDVIDDDGHTFIMDSTIDSVDARLASKYIYSFTLTDSEFLIARTLLPNDFKVQTNLVVRPTGVNYETKEELENTLRSIGDNSIDVISFHFICDICNKKCINFIRRLCSKCKSYYDICDECFPSEICPFCHEIDLKY